MNERLGVRDTAKLAKSVIAERGKARLWAQQLKPEAICQNIGPPNVTGRVGCLARDPRLPGRIFAGATGGGVWRTDDGGLNWLPCMAMEDSLAIGGLAVAPSSPDIIYAATGEWTADIGAGVDPVTTGAGVYKSTTGGSSWSLCAPISSSLCAVAIVADADANLVYVGGSRALHRSRDGGCTWDIGVGSHEGLLDGEVSDVALDPFDPNVLYVAMHGRGFFRSRDGGNSWVALTNGLPAGWRVDGPKLALGRSGKHGSRFVAAKSADAVFVSKDGGDSFLQIADLGDKISFYGWCNLVSVHPDNEDLLIAGSNNLHRSEDGGKSWRQVGGYGTNVHPDQQFLLWSMQRTECYLATDGGIWFSRDVGKSWRFVSRGLVGGHFYVIGVSQTKPMRVGGSVQDDDGYTSGLARDWTPLGRGEGGYVEFDPTDSSVIYHDTWFNELARSDNGGRTWHELHVNTDVGIAEPLAIHPKRPELLLATAQTGQLLRSTDRGQRWTQVGVPRLRFRSVVFAPSDSTRAYACGDNRAMICSRDAGATWIELDTSTLPPGNIHCSVVDPSDPNLFYVAFQGSSGERVFSGQVAPDASTKWTSLAAGYRTGCLCGKPAVNDLVDPIWNTRRATDRALEQLSALAGCAVVFIRDTLAPQLGETFPGSAVGAVHRAPSDYPSGKEEIRRAR